MPALTPTLSPGERERVGRPGLRRGRHRGHNPAGMHRISLDLCAMVSLWVKQWRREERRYLLWLGAFVSAWPIYTAALRLKCDPSQPRGSAGAAYSAPAELCGITMRCCKDSAPAALPATWRKQVSPSDRMAFKVFVILTMDNEAGSAAMSVERPVSVPLAA